MLIKERQHIYFHWSEALGGFCLVGLHQHQYTSRCLKTLINPPFPVDLRNYFALPLLLIVNLNVFLLCSIICATFKF